MKFAFALIGTVSLIACSTLSPKPEELQASEKCMVWQKDTVGLVQAREVIGEKARQQSTCWIMGMFGCSYINYTYRSGTGEILSDVGDKDKAIGRYDAQSNTIAMSRTGVTVAPARIEDGKIEYILDSIGPKQKKVVEYNKKCSQRQAALGAASFM